MHEFHSSRYLQSKLMFGLSHASMIKVQYISKWSALYTEKSQTLKMIETHFYRLYSVMTGSKIITGSQLNVWHLIL